MKALVCKLRALTNNVESIVTNADVIADVLAWHDKYDVPPPPEKESNNFDFLCKAYHDKCFLSKLGMNGSKLYSKHTQR